VENPRPSIFAVAITLAGFTLLAGLVFAVPALHDRLAALGTALFRHRALCREAPA